MECKKCGTCCIAPDISTLLKGRNQRCVHLTADMLCGIYENRPAVCKAYTPWELCEKVQDPDLEVRVKKFLEAFGMDASNQL
jgi:uncharacterized protein